MAPSRYIVIMAGGRGERFWPQSRQKKPKQLLPIVGEESLLAQTIHRVGGIVPLENIFVITNADYAQAVSEICDMLPAENVVAEPVGRDTAAAVGLSGLLVALRDPGASLAVLPSDHVIHDTAAFRKVVESAFEVAESGDHLVTIGIAPEFPATGYGYINRGAQCMQIGCLPVYEVKRFVEKPNLETAKHYVASGEFFWNAGMFIWSVKSLDCAMRALAPDIVAIFDGIAAEVRKGAVLRDVLAERYPSIRKISIDYAVMEKAKNVVTIPGIFDWDDVGAWPSLVRHLPADSHGNVLRGSAVVLDGSGNIIISSGDHLVSVMGLSNCIVVHTVDATLVCPREKAQDIKSLVREISSRPGLENKV